MPKISRIQILLCKCYSYRKHPYRNYLILSLIYLIYFHIENKQVAVEIQTELLYLTITEVMKVVIVKICTELPKSSEQLS